LCLIMPIIITRNKALTSNSNVEEVAGENTENITGTHYGMSRSSNSYDESQNEDEISGSQN